MYTTLNRPRAPLAPPPADDTAALRCENERLSIGGFLTYEQTAKYHSARVCLALLALLRLADEAELLTSDDAPIIKNCKELLTMFQQSEGIFNVK